MTPDDPPLRVIAAVHREDGRNTALLGTLLDLMRTHASRAGRGAARMREPAATAAT